MKSLILGIALLLFNNLQAQQVLLEKEFTDGRIEKAVPVSDGYLVLAHREREERIGNRIESYYQPYLLKLDGNFRRVWEKTWPEGTVSRIKDLKVAGNRIYLVGSHYPNNGKSCEGWLTQLNMNGHILSEKFYPYPRYHSVEGNWLEVLPNGDLIVMMRTYRNWGSMGTSWLLRLRPSGEKIWARHLGRHYKHCSLYNMIITADGAGLFTGHVIENETRWKQENSAGWMYKIDLNNPDRVYLDKVIDHDNKNNLGESIELENGDLWVLGRKQNHKGGKDACLYKYDASGNLLDMKSWSDPNSVIFRSFCWNPATERLQIVGYSKVHSGFDYWTPRFIEVDGEWSVMRDQNGERGAANTYITPFHNGEMMLVSSNKLQVVR